MWNWVFQNKWSIYVQPMKALYGLPKIQEHPVDWKIFLCCRLALMEPMLAGLQQESPIPCQMTTGVGSVATSPSRQDASNTIHIYWNRVFNVHIPHIQTWFTDLMAYNCGVGWGGHDDNVFFWRLALWSWMDQRLDHHHRLDRITDQVHRLTTK